jgi:hypothetical protein
MFVKRINSANVVKLTLALTCLAWIVLFCPGDQSVNVMHNVRRETINDSANHHEATEHGSKELATLIAEYRRKFSRSPPTNFDKWHRLATLLNCSLDLNDYR